MAQIAIKQGEVFTFKLNSGEELVAKVVQSGGDWIELEEPVSIAPTQKGMQFIPSMFTSEPKAEIRLNTNSISLFAQTEDSIKMKYIEMTTGIQVPDKQIILG
jgi:hypothetical protein